MVCRGWEFVQAYTSGENSGLTHYLLRIAPARLTAEQRAALLTPPERERPKPEKKAITRKRVPGTLFLFSEDLLFRHFLRILGV